MITRSIESDAAFSLWREEALKRGFVSCIGFPLRAGTQILGAFALYAAEPEAFDAAEVKLLAELAEDLGLGIETIRTREERKRAEEALRESEERYRLLFERNLAGVFRITLYGRILHCNQAMAGLLGYDSPQEVLAHRVQDFYFTEEEHARFISELTAAGWVTNYEMRMRRQDGSPVWVIANVSTKAEAPGDLRVMEGTLVDITARKLAEQRLGEYEKAVEGLEEMLAVVDREYRYVIANRTFLRYYGIKRPQITKLRVRDVMGAELFDSVIKARLDACFGGKVVRYELKLNSPRLGDRDLYASLFPIQGPKGVERAAIIIQDITERKHAEEALRRSEAYLAAGEKLSHTGSWAWNVASGELYWSQETYRIFGFDPAGTKASMQGSFLARIYPEDRPRVEAGLKLAAGQQNTFETDYRIVLPDRSLRHVHDIVYPVVDDTGNVVERFGVITDVTARRQAEQALIEERHLLHTLMDNLPDHVYFKDRESRFTRISKALAKEYGLSDPALALGKRDFDFFIPERAAEFYQDEQEIIRTGQPMVDKEEGGMWPDGHVTWLSTTKMPLRDANGNIIGTFGVSRNITERKQARERLHEYEKVVEGVDEMITVVDREYRYLLANRAFLRQRAMSHEAVVGRLVPEVLGTEYFDRSVKERLDECFRGNVVRFEARYVYPKLGARDLMVSYFPIEGPHGVDRAACVLQDITERKKAEEELRLTHFSVEHAPDAVFWMNSEGRILYANEEACRSLGRTREEIVALSIPDIDPLVSVAAWDATWEEIKTHGAMTHETQHRRKDGQTFPVEISAKYLEFGGNEYSFAFARDITERKRAEEALRQSEERFRQIAETIDEVFWIADPRITTTQYVSPAYERVWGRSCASLYANPRNFIEGIHPDDHQRVLADLEGEKSGQAFEHEYRVVRPDNTVRWVWDRGFPVHDDSGHIVRYVGVAVDITARKEAEAENTRLVAAIEQAAEGVIITNTAGEIEYANPSFSRMTGYGRDEVLGRNPRILKSGKQDSAAYEQLWTTILKGNTWQGELVNRRKDGTLYTEELSIAPVRGARGEITHFIATKQDVTERRNLEIQLRQAQKMEAVGRLAGGVAHDFNNLLTIINGYSDMALRRMKSQDLLRNHIEEIRKAGERAASLTRQLLAFSRQQVLAPRILDVRNLVADIEKMLRRLIGEDIELVTIRHAASSQVKADPGQLEEILVNLVINARDAMPEGGKLIIEVTNVVIEGTYVDQHPVVIPGHYVLMAVSDTGTGMTPEIQAHIFEPFFTTKEKGKGTGLGLAMVYGTVKQSGGYIWVYSELGRGATFKIYLPRIRDEAETAQDSEAPARPAMGSETILLVEDEEAVRALAAQSLEEQGYKVLESTSPEDAIEISRRYTEPIHLLLTDVVLPRISGRKIAEHLTPLRPGMKVLYMSGYTDDTILRAGVLEAGTAFLQKPFTPTSLAHRVREVLDAGKGENPKGSANGN